MSSAPVNWEKVAANPASASKGWSAPRLQFVIARAEEAQANGSPLISEEVITVLRDILASRAGARPSTPAAPSRQKSDAPAKPRAATISLTPRVSPAKTPAKSIAPIPVGATVELPTIVRSPQRRTPSPEWFSERRGDLTIMQTVRGKEGLVGIDAGGVARGYIVEKPGSGRRVELDDRTIMPGMGSPGILALGTFDSATGRFVAQRLLRPEMPHSLAMKTLASVFTIVAYSVSDASYSDIKAVAAHRPSMYTPASHVLVTYQGGQEERDGTLDDVPPTLGALDLMHKVELTEHPDDYEEGDEETQDGTTDDAGDEEEDAEPWDFTFLVPI